MSAIFITILSAAFHNICLRNVALVFNAQSAERGLYLKWPLESLPASLVFPPLQCELYHWVDLLDRFDGILCDAGQTVENMSWLLVCDRPDNGQLKALLLAVLNFTALLIEYSFSRHLYSSIEVGPLSS